MIGRRKAWKEVELVVENVSWRGLEWLWVD